ncbi:four helix bundle protein [Thermodesulfobacteriota bacterium]
MKGGETDIVKLSLEYSIQVVDVYRLLEKDNAGKILGKQFLRSGTSIGANVHEAQGAQSKADFIAKMSIAHKEARETAYWIQLFKEALLISPDIINTIAKETTKIIKILSSILLTSKRNHQQKPKCSNTLKS